MVESLFKFITPLLGSYHDLDSSLVGSLELFKLERYARKVYNKVQTTDHVGRVPLCSLLYLGS